MRRVSVATPVSLCALIVAVSSWGGYADATTRDHTKIRRLQAANATLAQRLEAVNERSWQAFLRANTIVGCVGLVQPVTSNPGEPLMDATNPANDPVGAHVYTVPVTRDGCWRLLVNPATLKTNYTMPTGAGVYP